MSTIVAIGAGVVGAELSIRGVLILGIGSLIGNGETLADWARRRGGGVPERTRAKGLVLDGSRP